MVKAIQKYILLIKRIKMLKLIARIVIEDYGIQVAKFDSFYQTAEIYPIRLNMKQGNVFPLSRQM